MEERVVLRIGAWAGVVGGILGIVVNAFNPLRPDADALGDPTAPLHAASSNGSWEVVQVGVLVTFVLVLGAFVALTRSITDPPAHAWARFALAAVTLGITLSVAGFAIYAQLAHAVDRLGVDSVVGVAVVAGGLLTGSQIILFGVGGLLYGLAIAESREYPTWLGLGMGLGGAVGLVSGIMDVVTGPSVVTTFALFPISSALLTLAVIYIGVLLLRRTAEPEGTPATG